MSPNRFKRHTLLGLCMAAAALAAPLAAQAQEITLKAVNAFQEGTYYARNFERFVKKVNDEGKGLIQINYIGGPKAIPTFEQGNALRSGVVDMSNTTTSFVAGIVPEGLAINYTNQTMAEMRKNGAIDYLNKIMMEKGLYYYARTGEGVQYYIYSNKRIDKADLTGLKLRIAPIYRDFFQKLGANVVQIAPGEVYTALERGVVDGYGWPLTGLFDQNWQKMTKFRVEPGFYNAEVSLVVNLDVWKKLNPKQRELLQKHMLELEADNTAYWKKNSEDEVKRQDQAGIQVIKFDPATAKQYLDKAYDSGWAGVIKNSPEYGPKLKQALTK